MSKDTTMKTIYDTAADAGTFSTLLSAVDAAGLTDTLRSAGPFTVFAPTDEAFKKIPSADLDALLKDVPRLKATLTYHVVPGSHGSKDLKPGELKTVEGRALHVVRERDEVRVDSAKLVTRDIVTSNGRIHAIDTVLMPKLAAVKAA
jgi:uncharacterized surface protein with fasciclin (FAS1) repeats